MSKQLPLFEMPAKQSMNLSEFTVLIRNHAVAVSNWQMCPPGAELETIEKLRSQAPFRLPESYLMLLAFSNGPSGPLGVRPSWFQIWPADNVLERNNALHVQDIIPGYFGFGSSGGGELLAFRTRSGRLDGIVMIPFIIMDTADEIVIAQSFEEFVSVMGVEHKTD